MIIYPSAKIFAIEPVTIFFECLKNLGDARVIPINIMIAKTQKSIYEIDGGGTSYPHENLLYSTRKSKKKHNPLSKTGDDLIFELSIAPDFIKVDTDGSDYEILQTLENTLKRRRPMIQFEFSYRFAYKAGYTLKDNINYLKKLGYTAYVIDNNSALRKILVPRLEVLNHQTKNFLAFPDEISDITRYLVKKYRSLN